MLGLWLGACCISSLAVDLILRTQRELPPTEPLQFKPEHYRTLAICWSLFTILYLPETGMENAPVGDELMEWLNTHYIAPPTTEADHLSTLDRPWEDDNFWPYLARSVSNVPTIFFINPCTVARHCEDCLKHPPSSWRS